MTGLSTPFEWIMRFRDCRGLISSNMNADIDVLSGASWCRSHIVTPAGRATVEHDNPKPQKQLKA